MIADHALPDSSASIQVPQALDQIALPVTTVLKSLLINTSTLAQPDTSALLVLMKLKLAIQAISKETRPCQHVRFALKAGTAQT